MDQVCSKIDDNTVKITGIVLQKPFNISAETVNVALCPMLKRVFV